MSVGNLNRRQVNESPLLKLVDHSIRAAKVLGCSEEVYQPHWLQHRVSCREVSIRKMISRHPGKLDSDTWTVFEFRLIFYEFDP